MEGAVKVRVKDWMVTEDDGGERLEIEFIEGKWFSDADRVHVDISKKKLRKFIGETVEDYPELSGACEGGQAFLIASKDTPANICYSVDGDTTHLEVHLPGTMVVWDLDVKTLLDLHKLLGDAIAGITARAEHGIHG